MVDIRKAPFSLNEEQAAWVEDTLGSMSEKEKIGQVFCGSVGSFDDDTIKHVSDLGFGGLMIRPFPLAGLKESLRKLQAAQRIPLFISGNLENGGSGVVADGTSYQMPMGATATGDPEAGYRLGKISTAEAAAVGVNWGYAPIVDIDCNFRNPITNIRAFSSHPGDVVRMARGYLKAAAEEGVAPTIKHFPGDGSDERDQHLLVSVNQLSAEDWMHTYGQIYRDLIAEEAPSVMVGHIAQPAVARMLNPDISDWDAYLPASTSKTLITDLLRGELGFNGLAVTDSTLMVGYMQKMPRKEALWASINAGIDMILFNRNMDEDVAYMTEGVETGKITRERLDDACRRILAMKAYLHLPEKQAAGELVPTGDAAKVIRKEEFLSWVREAADQSVTLIKDRDVLPLSPEKTKRIYLNVIEWDPDTESDFARDMKARFEKEGFAVTLRKRSLKVNMAEMLQGIVSEDAMRVMAEIRATTESFVSRYDLCVLLVDMPTMSNSTTVRIFWSVFAGLGNDIPWYSGEMPVVTVSFANPYHLLDIPMSAVYVNAYTDIPEVRDAVMEKLMGRSTFKGISPVDASCGHEDTML